MADRFVSLKYPVQRAKQALDKEFPDLFRHKEFKKIRLRKDWENLTRYIVFLYDKGTDLTFEYTDLTARKDAAAMEAGYLRTAGKWPKDVQDDVLDIQQRDVHAAIMCYLKIQRSDVWTDIVTTEQELEEFQGLRMTTLKKGKDVTDADIFEAAKKKDLLMAACDKRVKHLKNRYADFYGDHVDVQASEFEEMITPETAMRLLSGSRPWQEQEEAAVAKAEVDSV